MRTFYINGEPADIDDKTTINLSYKSPIFSDLQKLIANTTLTIKLPRTAHNHKLINNIGSIGVQSKFGYDYFRADYVVDGLSMIENGVGYILNISDSIEVSVIFGGVSGLEKIKDVKLNEIPLPASYARIIWGGDWAQIGNTDGVFFPYAEFGVNASDEYKITEHVHPSVRVSQIVNWINEAYSLDIAPIGEQMVVPCVTKMRRDGWRDIYYNVKDQQFTQITSNRISSERYQGVKDGNLFTSNDGGLWWFAEYTCNISISATIEISKEIMGDMVDVDIRQCVVSGGNWEGEEQLEKSDDGLYEVFVEKGRGYRFFFDIDPMYIGYYLRRVNYEYTCVEKELIYGGAFDAIYNLPAIKVLDFLKSIMQIQGVFPRVNSDGSLGCTSINELYLKINQAKDWSDKLIEVKTCSFRFLDFAQQNTILWAEDETAPYEKIMAIEVDNKTLEPEREAIKLPFASTENAGQQAIIPLYKNTAKEGDPEEIEMENIKPRIMWFGSRSTGLLTCTPIAREEIIECYNKYQEIIRTPKVVKCSMKLSARDLSELDLTVPVYVEQLSGHYAVMEVTTRGDVADVEMLML